MCPTRVPIGRCGSPRWCVMHSSSGIPRRLAVADAAFASHRNDRVARQDGVRCVVLPRQRREARSRRVRAALRWRTGSEGRISVLKRRHGLRRCRYRGVVGMERWWVSGCWRITSGSWAARVLRPAERDDRAIQWNREIEDGPMAGSDGFVSPTPQPDATSALTFAPGSRLGRKPPRRRTGFPVTAQGRAG